MVKHDIFSEIRSGCIAINMNYDTIKHSPYWISGLIVLVALNACDINSFVQSRPAVSYTTEGSASPGFSSCCGSKEIFGPVVVQQCTILGWEDKRGMENIF